MKKQSKKLFGCTRLAAICLFVVFALAELTGCFPARDPKNYYLNDLTTLPEEVETGNYRLASLKYRNIKSSVSMGEYFDHFKNSEVQLKNSVFQMGDETINSPHYRELEFWGIIRIMGTKNDHYRPVRPNKKTDVDMDESEREVKRCIAVFDSEDNDTGYRIYIFDNEIWLAHFGTTEEIEWICDDIFVLSKAKI